jgi:DNA-binding transcriptional MocR family regulator
MMSILRAATVSQQIQYPRKSTITEAGEPHCFGAGTRLSLPPGGLNLWVELPAGASSSKLFEQALEAGIRIAPGSMFSNTRRYDGFVRLGCTAAFTDELEQAYKTLGQLLGAKNGRGGSAA